jgi:two-component system LytT family response regulator
LFHREKPSLIFLDIRMPSGSEGFELIEALEGENFEVVFVTAFKEYAIRAFEQQALHYILKPIDEDDLREVVRRVSLSIQTSEVRDFEQSRFGQLQKSVQHPEALRRITIHHARGIRIVDLKEVDHLESEGNCTILHFRNGQQYLDTRTLKIYEALLPDHFFRIHRSHIANLEEVKEVLLGDDYEIVLKSGKRIPIARERKKDLLDRIHSMG